MIGHGNGDLLLALARSPTFSTSMLNIVLPAFGIVWLLATIPAQRVRSRRLVAAMHAEIGGAVLAADLVLILVPLIVIMLVMLQTLWLMRETVIVHYAAFAAARSARVYRCPPMAESALALSMQVAGRAGCQRNEVRADERAEYAARMALISASPPWGVPCQQNCDVPEEALRALAATAGAEAQSDAIIDQARYAFDRDNVRVEISFDPVSTASAIANPGSMPIVTAHLTFRHYVTFGIGRMLGTQRNDGYYYRETEAEVSLL